MTQDDYQSSTTQLVHLVLVDLRLLFDSCSGMVKKSSLVLARKRLLGYLAAHSTNSQLLPIRYYPKKVGLEIGHCHASARNSHNVTPLTCI